MKTIFFFLLLFTHIAHLLAQTAYPRPCPTGFSPVNSNYCIEINERDSQDWGSATEICSWDESARLCTAAEWVAACNHSTELGLVNMVNNWEWIDDSKGTNKVALIGFKDCSDVSRAETNEVNKYAFRCCKSR